jgi:hypothetical protein
VTDATGATVSGVQVSIENLGTHITRSTLTGTSGDYVLTLLPPRRYTLRIGVTGFKNSALPDLIPAACDRARADMQMQIGQLEETVEAVEKTPELQSNRGDRQRNSRIHFYQRQRTRTSSNSGITQPVPLFRENQTTININKRLRPLP